MNDEEFESTRLLKLKYRRVDETIETSCKIAFPKKLGPLSLIARNFKTLKTVLLNHA